ncbi:MAG: hypothetical protein Kow00106_21440 [Anaerolineae bacterium]
MNEFRHRRYQRDPALIAQEALDETIVVPLGQSGGAHAAPYVLNEVAGYIWSLLDGERTVADIAALIAARYEVSPEEAERDVSAFLGEMERLGVVYAV